MILDIIVVVIVISTMVQGYRHGLLNTFINTIGWFISLALGFVLSPKINELIVDNTNLYTNIYTNINEKTGTMLTPEQVQTDMPAVIQNPFLTFTNSLSHSVADSLTSFIITILCFIVVTTIINFLFKIILRVFSRKHNHSLLGFTDGAFGLLFGFIKGILYVFILLACMFPLTSLANVNLMNLLAESLHNSHFAMDLYHNNLVLLLVRDLF